MRNLQDTFIFKCSIQFISGWLTYRVSYFGADL